MQSTRRQILDLLRERGDATVEMLAEHVGLAPVTVRHHLNVLRKRGLVSVESEPIGRGRPRHVYRLSPRGGKEVVEDRYEQMAGRLLQAMKDGSRRSAEGFFRAMADSLLDDRPAQLRDAPVEIRLEAIAELLGREGFTIHWEARGDGYILEEIACPYEALGSAHSEVCCMDRHVIESLIDGQVERIRWRPDGDAVCAYRVVPATEGTDGG